MLVSVRTRTGRRGIFRLSMEGEAVVARESGSCAREGAPMGGRVGCWRMVAVAGLAGLLPTFLSLLHPGSGSVPRLAARPPVCLEAWVRLRSYRGCPVLAAAAGYRLEIHCFWGGHQERSDGALVFAGPFAGRAFISERPVPLGRWVHLAGLEGSLGAASLAGIAPTADPSNPPMALVVRKPSGPPMAPAPPIPAAVLFDGRDVTAGRLVAQADPLPLGYDPGEERPAAIAGAGASGGCGGPAAFAGGRDPVCRDRPALDGEIGTWRLSRAWRSLAQVAAARGSPWRLAPLPPPPQEPAPGATAAAGGPGGGISARGWKILAAGLLLALAMTGAGMALRLRKSGAPTAAAAGGAALDRARVQR